MSITLTAAVVAAAAAAGVGLAAQGAGRAGGYFLGGGRAAKKSREKELASAEKAWKRGQRRGWGDSDAEKNAAYANVRAEIDQSAAGQEDQLAREDAARGFGRSGTTALKHESITRAKGDAYAKTRAAMQQQFSAKALQEKGMVQSRLAAARGTQQAVAQQNMAVGQQMAGGAASMGMSFYQSETAAELERKRLDMQAAQSMEMIKMMQAPRLDTTV